MRFFRLGPLGQVLGAQHVPRVRRLCDRRSLILPVQHEKAALACPMRSGPREQRGGGYHYGPSLGIARDNGLRHTDADG